MGLLSLVAILFSARNIVLPLMDLSSANEKLAVRSGTLLAAQGISSGPGSVDHPAAAQITDVAAVRSLYFGDGSYRRNPFLYADDSRQPGQRSSLKQIVFKAVGQAAAVVEPVSPETLFSLNAILVRDGQKYALINRQVSAVGDVVLPIAQDGYTPGQRLQLEQMLKMEYTVKKISQNSVELGSSDGNFDLSLAY